MTQKLGSTPKSSAKKVLLRLLRVALAVAPVVWIYTRTDAGAFGEAVAAMDMRLLFAILALSFICVALQGIKWWVLIRRFAPELKMSKAVIVHLESAFYSFVLPMAAQDIVKSAMLSRTHSPSVVWAASWLARLAGLLSLLAFSVTGLIYLESGILPAGFRVSLITAIAATALLGAFSFSKKMTRPIRAITAKIISPKIMSSVEKLREGIYAFKYARKTLALTFLISTAINSLAIFCISLAVYAVSGKFYLIECLALVPLVEIMVIALPLTPGGIGVREALMALFFTRLGFSGEQTAMYVTIGLLMSMVRITGGIPPLYRVITKRK